MAHGTPLRLTQSTIHMYIAAWVTVQQQSQHDTHLMAIFQDNPGKYIPERLHHVIGAKDDGGGGGDNWCCKMCKAPVKLSSLISQHPTSYRLDALPRV